MKFIKTCVQAICLTLVVAFLSNSAHAASVFEKVSDGYKKVTNPVSWSMDQKVSGFSVLNRFPIDPRTPSLKNKAEPFPYKVAIDYYSAVLNADKYRKSHKNTILNIMTFGNQESQRNLNVAYRMAVYVNQYHLFAYAHNRWYYLPVHMDAGSMLVYGVGYILNIPQRVLTKINAIWDADAMPYKAVGVGKRLLLMIDVVVSTLSQVIELVLAVIGTVVGTIVALICHPTNSLCSIVGMFYFAVPLLWSAIAGSLISLVGIFL